MRWFPWWNRAIKRQRRDRFPFPLLSFSSTLLATHSSWHHSDGEHTHSHTCSGWCGNRLQNWNHPKGRCWKFCCWNLPDAVSQTLGDLEVKRVMSLWSVGQQPGVSACVYKSWLWAPEDWNKPARNYLVDKGRARTGPAALMLIYSTFIKVISDPVR